MLPRICTCKLGVVPGPVRVAAGCGAAIGGSLYRLASLLTATRCRAGPATRRHYRGPKARAPRWSRARLRRPGRRPSAAPCALGATVAASARTPLASTSRNRAASARSAWRTERLDDVPNSCTTVPPSPMPPGMASSSATMSESNQRRDCHGTDLERRTSRLQRMCGQEQNCRVKSAVFVLVTTMAIGVNQFFEADLFAFPDLFHGGRVAGSSRCVMHAANVVRCVFATAHCTSTAPLSEWWCHQQRSMRRGTHLGAPV
jgi:hypothetical protein